MTREICLYGLSETALGERLADLYSDPAIGVALSYTEGRCTVRLTGERDALDTATAAIAERMGAYVYSYEGESLAACVVRRLTALGLTVATAESCTGGLIAAALTDVPGASRVFGTGVVSYSNDCKAALLSVSSDTLTAVGAVSAETVGQMARGVRQTGSAAIGVAVTGEAGPHPAEDLPVGTVFVALADKKRTWVEELHLEGPDRASIRRQAADSVLWLLWRYLSAYPAVMAGGESNHAAQKRVIPRTQGTGQPRLLSLLLPWKGDSRRRLAVKCTAWLLALAVLAGSGVLGYQHFVQPYRNLELQESLGDLYWEESTDLTDDTDTGEAYPAGMLPVFRGLYDMNPDVGGWLHIPDTGVDYPVMNYTDGYYDNHSFLKEYSIYGQPYFGSPTRYASVVYGQNTGDGQMFSELLNYRRVAYLQEHNVIECNTIYQNSRWQIFAVVVMDDRNPEEFSLPTEDFGQDEEYLQYLTEIQERSLFLGDVSLTAEDRLLVLSTNAQQEYGFSGARLAVFARLVEGDMPAVTYRVNNLAKMPAAMYGNAGATTRTLRGTTQTASQTEPASTTATGDQAQTTQTTASTAVDSSTSVTTATTVSTSSTESGTQTTQTATGVVGGEDGTQSTTETTQPTGESDATTTEPTAIDPTATEATDPSGESTAYTETTLPTEGTTVPSEEGGALQ